MAALDPLCAAIEPKCAGKPATTGCCCVCEPRTGVMINGAIFGLFVSCAPVLRARSLDELVSERAFLTSRSGSRSSR